MKPKFLSLCIALALLAGLHQAAAQNTTVTYQGRITDNGANFTGTGEFEFALVTSSNASQIATAMADPPSNGFITGYVVTTGGNGYINPPVVTVSGGGGTGATATANVSGGAVTRLTVNSFGDGNFTSAPTVTIAPPPVDIAYVTYWSNDGASASGSEPSAPVAVGVSNGLFTVVLGDTTVANMAALPSSVFNQPNLQLRIWFSDGVNGFAALSPVQNLTATPYAAVANSASNLLGTVAAAQLSGAYPGAVTLNNPANIVNGAFSGDGGALTNLNALQFAPGTGLFIQQNSGNTPNVIEGGSANSLASDIEGTTIGGGDENTVSDNFTTVGGGEDNTASVADATVGGGTGNIASGLNATVGGGGGISSTKGFGGTNLGNTASGSYSTVGGGVQNQATATGAAVPGGIQNLAGGKNSFAAGFQALATNDGSFVWSDGSASTASTAQDSVTMRATGGYVFFDRRQHCGSGAGPGRDFVDGNFRSQCQEELSARRYQSRAGKTRRHSDPAMEL